MGFQIFLSMVSSVSGFHGNRRLLSETSTRKKKNSVRDLHFISVAPLTEEISSKYFANILRLKIFASQRSKSFPVRSHGISGTNSPDIP